MSKDTGPAGFLDPLMAPTLASLQVVRPPLNVNAARAECQALGLGFDEEGAAMALDMAQQRGLTQAQFDAAMALHARRVKFLFTPPVYGWRGRIAIAFHFLFNPRRWRA